MVTAVYLLVLVFEQPRRYSDDVPTVNYLGRRAMSSSPARMATVGVILVIMTAERRPCPGDARLAAPKAWAARAGQQNVISSCAKMAHDWLTADQASSKPTLDTRYSIIADEITAALPEMER